MKSAVKYSCSILPHNLSLSQPDVGGEKDDKLSLSQECVQGVPCFIPLPL